MADCVRNKQRRLRIYQREKAAKKKDKRKLREKRKREREELGDEVGVTHVRALDILCTQTCRMTD